MLVACSTGIASSRLLSLYYGTVLSSGCPICLIEATMTSIAHHTALPTFPLSRLPVTRSIHSCRRHCPQPVWLYHSLSPSCPQLAHPSEH